MNKTIEILLNFESTGEIPEELENTISMVERSGTWSILCELFGWLRRQYRFKHEKPLELHSDHTWCQLLPTFLESLPELNNLFEIENNQLRFRSSVDPETRSQIREQVFNGYDAGIMTVIERREIRDQKKKNLRKET